MRVRAVQTGTVAVRARQREGRGRGKLRLANTLLDRQWTEPLPIYAWVVEHSEGVIVVDTGETARAAQRGYFPRWHPYFRFGLREWVEPEQEIGPQLRTVGITPDQVRWVVLTHLHTDHAGGLDHFPSSEFLISRREFAAASGFTGKMNGYLPQRWPSDFSPRLVDFEHEALGPFPDTARLTEAGDVRLLSTPGHSVGHLSVLIDEGEGRYLLLAGDTSYTEELMLRQAVDGVAPDVDAAKETLARLLRFCTESQVVYLPSHDPASGARLASRQTVVIGETAASG